MPGGTNRVGNGILKPQRERKAAAKSRKVGFATPLRLFALLSVTLRFHFSSALKLVPTHSALSKKEPAVLLIRNTLLQNEYLLTCRLPAVFPVCQQLQMRLNDINGVLVNKAL